MRGFGTASRKGSLGRSMPLDHPLQFQPQPGHSGACPVPSIETNLLKKRPLNGGWPGVSARFAGHPFDTAARLVCRDQQGWPDAAWASPSHMGSTGFREASSVFQDLSETVAARVFRTSEYRCRTTCGPEFRRCFELAACFCFSVARTQNAILLIFPPPG